MKFRRLNSTGKYVDVSDESNNEEEDVEYYAPGPIETSFIAA